MLQKIQKLIRAKHNYVFLVTEDFATQKPVAAPEYLIQDIHRTGKQTGFLDFHNGESGSTGVACINTGRNFIGIELDEWYFDIAQKTNRSGASC